MAQEEEALRQEVARLQGELARERARGEANRIAHEAELADAHEVLGGGAPAPLLYAWGARDHQVLRVKVGDKDVTAVIGGNWDDMNPGQIWAAIQRLTSEDLAS